MDIILHFENTMQLWDAINIALEFETIETIKINKRKKEDIVATFTGNLTIEEIEILKEISL